MKKILFHLDTDPIPNTFDTVVGYDGGADHVSCRGNVKPSTVGTMVDGAVFTRPPRLKKNTALFVTGSNTHWLALASRSNIATASKLMV